jgi:hypothetical protein
MNLNVNERLVALSILPHEGNIATLGILEKLRLSLALTEKEWKDWGVWSDEKTNKTGWKVNGEAEIPIGEKATDIIIKTLKRLNEIEKIPDHGKSLYEKFIPTNE